MNLFNKSIAGLTAIALTVSGILPVANVAQAAGWEQNAYDRNADLDPRITNADSVSALQKLSTREEAVAFLSRFTENYDFGLTFDASTNCDYTDMANIMPDLTDEVMAACEAGIIKSATTNPMFNAKALTTEGQFATMLARLVSGDPTMEVGDANAFLSDEDVMGQYAYTSYKGDKTLSKILALEMLRKLALALEEPVVDCTIDPTMPQCLPSTTGTVNTGTVVEVKAGALGISLAPTSPAARNIPMVGTVPFGTFALTAGSSDITVRSLTVTRTQLGDRNDISSVFFELNGRRVSGRQTLGSDQKAIISISPALVLKAGETTNLDLVIGMSGTAGNGVHAFTIADAMNVDSSASSVTGLPVSTNTMTTTNYPVASTQFDVQTAGSSLRAGDMNAELGRFSVFNQDNNKVETFRSITLRNDGNGDAAASLANLKVERNGSVVSSSVVTNGRYVTFVMNNDQINGGVTANYVVRGDVTSVQNSSGDDYRLRLQSIDDLNVVENDTMFRTKTTFANSLSTSMGTYTVAGGDVVLTRTAGALTTQTVAAGQQDQVLLDGLMTIRTSVRLGDLTVVFNTGAGFTGNFGQYFSNLKLEVGGTIRNTFNVQTTSANSALFQGQFDVTSTSRIRILGTVRSNISSLPTATFKINDLGGTSFGIKEYADANNNTISSVAGTTPGINTIVGNVTMTVTKNDGLSSMQVVRGTSDQLVFAVRVQAGDVSALKLSNLKIRNMGSSFATFSQLANFSLSTSLSGAAIDTKAITADGVSGAVLFNFPQITIPVNQSTTFYVRATFANSVATGSVFQAQFASGDLTNVTDSIGNNVTPSFTTINGSVLTLRDAGTLNITSADTQVVSASRSLIAPNSTVKTFGFNLAAQDDTIRLTDVYLTVTGVNPILLTDRVASVRLLQNGLSIANGSVFDGGVRFNLGDSSAELINAGMDKSYAVEMSFNSPTSTGSYVATGLKLMLGTGGVPSSEVKAGTTIAGIRATSVNAASTVAVNGVIASAPQHFVSAGSVLLSPVGTNASFNGSTIAYKFSITPSLAGGKVQINSVTMRCTYAAGTPTVSLLNGDQSAQDPSNLMSVGSQTLNNGTNTVISVVAPSARGFNSQRTFTVFLNAGMGAGAKTCNIVDVNASVLLNDQTTLQTVGSLNVFGNVGFNGLIPATLN